ncbi:MAG TPA: cation diffusion facilitator family transporter [Candidatus Kryptonia bacterium]|nr:cation diffusion facilitator family transporter [Candidatus Kryptonia bacterium]
MASVNAAAIPAARFDASADLRIRLSAAVASLIVGSGLLAAKYVAYQLTASTAILSDAMESIVNVAAAGFAIGGLVFAGRPADRNHPYGHGKIEFFSAAFEGGLIAFAAVMIVYEAGRTLLAGGELRQLDLGLSITGGAGAINLALGAFLIRTGRRSHSLTLIADGQHVLSDFWTSLGVVVGLLLVRVTGLVWLDPLVAGLVGLNLAWTGLRLVRGAAAGLLDEEDTELVRKLLAALNASMVPGIIRVHNLRAIRSGRFSHIDAHLVVPEFWTVERAHDAADTFEREVITGCGIEGEIVFHTDPCRRAYCARCDIADCPIRVEPFRSRPALTVEEVVKPDVVPG